MSFRGEIAKRLLKTFGPDAWNEFWVAFAQQVVEKETKFKDQPSAGKLKAAEVKAWAHARLAPLLPDFTEAAIFAWLDGILDVIVAKSNEIVGQDWVTGVESIEAYFAQILEPLLDVDLDKDGTIAGKPITVILVLGLLLASHPGPCQAQRRPLVEHYQSADAPPPPPDAPRPRSDDVKGTGMILPAVSVSTWTGYRGNASHGTWDAGLGVTLKANATWQPSLLFGKGGVGAGVAYKRLGAMAFWDGSLTGGVYLRPFDF